MKSSFTMPLVRSFTCKIWDQTFFSLGERVRHTLGQSIPYSSSYEMIAFGTPTDFKREFLTHPCSQVASLVAQLVKNVCNAGDPGSIPGSGRSPGEGIGYPFQYSWASLVAQLVRNPPAVRETWVQSLGWEDPLEEGKATHSSILAWRIPWPV